MPFIPTPLDGGVVYTIHADRRVLVADSPDSTAWLPGADEACMRGGAERSSGWLPIGVRPGAPPNARRCSFDAATAEAMLERFAAQHGVAMRDAFGATSCEHRPAHRRKAYVTSLSRELAPDSFHADSEALGPLAGRLLGLLRLLHLAGLASSRRELLTVLAYPHEAWPEAWGGHTEFAASVSGEEVAGGVDADGEARRAALRLVPSPGRSVVFHGALHHRAAWPSADAGSGRAGSPAGLRWSVVMQLSCEVSDARRGGGGGGTTAASSVAGELLARAERLERELGLEHGSSSVGAAVALTLVEMLLPAVLGLAWLGWRARRPVPAAVTVLFAALVLGLHLDSFA